MNDRIDEIRHAAWAEINLRRDEGCTQEEIAGFISGLFVMFHLFNLGVGPLFTWDGTGDGVPREVK